MAPEPRPTIAAMGKNSRHRGASAKPSKPSATSPLLPARSAPTPARSINRPATRPERTYPVTAQARTAPMSRGDRPKRPLTDGHATPSTVSGSPSDTNAA